MNEGDYPAQLKRLVNGFRVSQCIHVAVELAIADHLRGGARSCAVLAERTGSQPAALERLLRVLARAGIVHRESDGRFALTPLGELLCKDADGSMRAEIRNNLHASSWAAWGQLLYSVETGQAAFPKIFGKSAWEYRAENPEAGRIFDEMARSMSARSRDVILNCLDLSNVRRVVDVGGGDGTLLAGILARWPALQGVLFDRPAVTAKAERVLNVAGVRDRCRIVAGDFFDEVPAGGDLYLLKAIIHDWDDKAAIAILNNCRQAMTNDASIVLVESLLDPDSPDDRAFMDLHMLVIHGGLERTPAEFGALFDASGFRLDRVQRTGTGPDLIHGKPA